MADAAARFYAAASSFPIDEPPKTEAWDELIHEAQQNIKINTIANSPRWKSAMKLLRAKVTGLVSEWDGRAVCVPLMDIFENLSGSRAYGG